ncbi:MAG: serine/threonine protein kinase [Myxococcales bacterium]|nr:serine/threonine protein kinase [Myxococcales bacterium]
MSAEEESQEKLPESIAGRYRIRRLLGRGGFGAVYEAYDQLEERLVALKVIRHDIEVGTQAGVGTGSSRALRSQAHPPSSSSRLIDPLRKTTLTTRTFSDTKGAVDDVTARFKDEFRLLTQLHHPNLAAVYDFGRCDEQDSFYFTQELIHGQSLGDFLKGKPRETIVEIMVQLARALDYIHTLGFVHEDIKPSNVLVCAPESVGGVPQAKIIDFGLARVLRRPSELVADEDDEEVEVHGTPGFSAPEKVRGETTDARSDIYSLAATLYTAIRGQKPFPSRDFREALRNQRDWRPELAGAVLSSAGPVIAELIGRMLQPDPNKRPQSARSIVLELLRRESAQIRSRQASAEDRKEFARVLVEHLPFVDRAGYLDILLTRAVEVLRPEAVSEPGRLPRPARLMRTVFVEAPEGMGKQRLMAEVRREVQLGDGLFVEANCWGGEGGVGPFGPVVLQLATALGERSSTIRRYAELVKAARGRRPDDVISAQLIEFLISAAGENPFVLHLSDLARGGETVRTAVDHLVRAIDHNEARILLCVTTEPHTKLRPMVEGLGREQLAEVWNLRPFTKIEMHAVLQGILGDAQILGDLTAMLDKLTGGHPLSFRETLRVLIEESILVRDADSWVLRGSSVAAEQLHKSLAQRSEGRLDGLGVSAWEIASILYLIEAPIEERQLAELSDLRRERFRRTLDRLESEGLVVRSATVGSNLVTLAHESVREAVRMRYGDALNETRLDLAERIDELDSPDANLIYLRARLLDDASDGLESADALEAAANALFKANQPQLATRVIERLITRLRRYGRIPALPRLLKAKLQLLEQGAGALDDPQREAAHYQAGILVAELLGDYRAQAIFRLGLVDRFALDTTRDAERALERLEQATATAKLARDKILELRIAIRRAEILLNSGEIEQAVHHSGEAMKIVDYDNAGDADVMHIIGVRIRCLSLAGHFEWARELHDFAKPIAARVPVVLRRSYLSGIAFLAVLGGEPECAVPETRQAIEELRSANTTRLLIPPLHNLGDLLLRTGHTAQAAEAFREAIRLSGLHGYDFHVNLNRGFLGYTIARMGEVEEGAAMLAEAKAGMLQIQGEHVAQQQLRLLDAELAHLRGQSPRARRELEEMLADFESAKEFSLANWAKEALARIERDRGTTFIEAPSGLAEAAVAPDEETVRTKPVR